MLLERAPSGHRRGHRAYWKARCVCGNVVVVGQDHVLERRVISCGCASRDLSAERDRIGSMTVAERTPTYWMWLTVIARRVIGDVIERRWLDLEHGLARFVEDVGRRPDGRKLIRRDPTGPWNAANARWL